MFMRRSRPPVIDLPRMQALVSSGSNTHTNCERQVMGAKLSAVAGLLALVYVTDCDRHNPCPAYNLLKRCLKARKISADEHKIALLGICYTVTVMAE